MVYLGSDHGGFELKEQLKVAIPSFGAMFEDLGAMALNPDDDYPQFAQAVAKKVAQKPGEHMGILLCRTGGGMAIAANRFRGVRAVECRTTDDAIYAREHNHANVLVLPVDLILPDVAFQVVQTFLATPFSTEPRHSRRVAMIDQEAETKFVP